MNSMKCFYIVVFGLCLLQPAYADTVDTSLKYDQVRIGYIPSRSASFKGKPHKFLEARSLVHHKNTEIEQIFTALSDVAAEGVIENATRFHQPFIYIEAMYQGESVRLSFSGESNVEGYRHYEERWKSLHKTIYEYLVKEMSPDHRFNLTP